MKIANVITVTTAEVTVSIRNEAFCIIMEKTFPLTIPERVSEQMTDIRVETVIHKHEYRLDRTVKKTLAPDGMIIAVDHIDPEF